MPQFSDDLFLGAANAYQGTGNYPVTGIFSATISGTTLTVVSNLSGDPLVVGAYIKDASSSVTAGTYITAVTSATTATVSTSQTVASATTMYQGGNALLADPAPMATGAGPLGRQYVWDIIPQASVANNLVTSTTPASLTTSTLTLTAGTAVTSSNTSPPNTPRADGSTTYFLDVPRNVVVTNGSFTAATFVTANISTAAAGSGGSAGAFTVSTTPLVGLAVGQTVTVTGTNSGTSGLAAGTYIISATNGTTTFTLVTTAGAAIATTASGTNTGLTFSNALTAVTVTVSGYDYYGQAMTQAITTSASSAGTAASTKTFYQISGVKISSASGGSLTLGTGNVLGSPIRITDAGYITSVGWSNTLARDAGTFVAAVLTTASSTTGDVRGTYTPSSNPNGSARLVMTISLPALGAGPNATVAGLLGNTQA
jgi:hypothetical protein